MIYLSATIFFILLQAFFSGIETGLISVQRTRIRHEVKNGNCAAAVIEYFINRPPLMLTTCLIGTNICVVCAALLASRTAEYFHAGKTGMLVIPGILTVVMLAAEIIPKNWFRQSPEERCMRFAPLFYVLYLILLPPSRVVAWFTTLTTRFFARGYVSARDPGIFIREDFRLLLRDSEEAGTLSPETADILDNAVDFYRLKVKEVMTPAKNVFSVRAKSTIAEAMKLCRENNISRIPVTAAQENSTRNWIGIFNLYDAIFNVDENKWSGMDVTACMRIPEIINGEDNIREIVFRTKKMQCPLLLVVDDKNNQIGIVTQTDATRKIFS